MKEALYFFYNGVERPIEEIEEEVIEAPKDIVEVGEMSKKIRHALDTSITSPSKDDSWKVNGTVKRTSSWK